MADWAGVSPVSSITQRPTEHALQSADLLPCLSPWWLLLSQATYFTKTAFCSSLYWKHQAKPITGINRPVISRKVSLFVCEGFGAGGGGGGGVLFWPIKSVLQIDAEKKRFSEN